MLNKYNKKKGIFERSIAESAVNDKNKLERKRNKLHNKNVSH